jgi:hypothetical protein
MPGCGGLNGSQAEVIGKDEGQIRPQTRASENQGKLEEGHRAIAGEEEAAPRLAEVRAACGILC